MPRIKKYKDPKRQARALLGQLTRDADEYFSLAYPKRYHEAMERRQNARRSE